VFGPVPNGKCDLNAARAFSTDPFGDNWGYVDAGFSETRAIDYDLRETIWQDHIDFHMGLFWFFHDPSNTRCPANVRNGWRNWWLPYDEHTDPWPGDPAGFPTQLYVREGRRIISDVTLTQYDMSRADSATVPFDDVIGLGSYSIDSHHCNRIALEYAPGQFRAWNEGSVYAVGGGVEQSGADPLSRAAAAQGGLRQSADAVGGVRNACRIRPVAHGADRDADGACVRHRGAHGAGRPDASGGAGHRHRGPARHAAARGRERGRDVMLLLTEDGLALLTEDDEPLIMTPLFDVVLSAVADALAAMLPTAQVARARRAPVEIEERPCLVIIPGSAVPDLTQSPGETFWTFGFTVIGYAQVASDLPRPNVR
jgi:hypothetical protein